MNKQAESPKAGEVWKSRESALQAKVISANDEVDWYSIPQWNRTLDCARSVWNASMQRVAA
jgi:hypothetical protein